MKMYSQLSTFPRMSSQLSTFFSNVLTAEHNTFGMSAWLRTFLAASRSLPTAYKVAIIRSLISAPLASSRGRNPGARGRRISFDHDHLLIMQMHAMQCKGINGKSFRLPRARLRPPGGQGKRTATPTPEEGQQEWRICTVEEE